MRHLFLWATVASSVALITGCQNKVNASYSQEVSRSQPLFPDTNAAPSADRDNCNKLPNCEVTTIFPDSPGWVFPEGIESCRAFAVIHRGPAQRPEDVDLDVKAKVWVAIIVPAKGGRPRTTRVVGSTDVRFEESAERMARSYVFSPMICNGVGYQAYTISPMIFGPTPKLKAE